MNKILINIDNNSDNTGNVQNNNENQIQNNNINNTNNNKNEENNSKNSFIFKEGVNKGIYDYISIIKFCASSKNLNSADNISEEIDLDDMNDDDDIEENDKIGNNKNFVLTNFDELDDEDNISGDDSIEEIYKKTTETIRAIKLRNKMNNEDKDKEENNNKNNEDKNICDDKKDKYMELEEKKINAILNKNNDKEKQKFNILIDKEIQNSLPLIKKENDETKNTIKRAKSELNDNPETSNEVCVKSIFDYNNKKMNVLPKIRKKLNENEHGRYFYKDTNPLSRTGYNLNDKINNFRSNNIIKIKENKDTSLFNGLRKSSENSSNYKYKLTLLHHIKQNDDNK